MPWRFSSLFFIVGSLYALFPITTALEWTKIENPTRELTLPDEKSVTLRWEWRLTQSNEIFSNLVVYRSLNRTKTRIGGYFGDPDTDSPTQQSNAYYTLNYGGKGERTGFAQVIILDVRNQGSNVDVMGNDYVYSVTLNVAPVKSEEKSTTVVVKNKPSVTITTNPAELKYVTSNNQKVTITCEATQGRPTPKISWDIKETAGGISTNDNKQLTFNTFTKDKSGLYTCTATNAVGSASKIWVIQYAECGAGCTSDDKIAIQMTGLTYDEQYSNSQSAKFKDLKAKVEEECMKLYSSSSEYNIYSCQVLSFRKGSVVANMKITYSDSNQNRNMRQPLINQLATGTFADIAVNKDFVSPTSPPTQTTQQKKTTVDSSEAGRPDSGARADSGGGLSTGAIVAIVVVFSIIFIVIIIVLVVCMLKRKKPASSKKYGEDDNKNKQVSTPLKSQQYKGPLYENDDRHNGGVPPPQYTDPEYADVRPTHPNDSNMEWDKDVDDKNEMWI